MDNKYAQKYGSQSQQRNTSLASSTGFSWKRKRHQKRKSQTDDTKCISTAAEAEQHQTVVDRGIRVKRVVFLCGTLVFGLMFLLLLTLALQFPFTFTPQIPENDNALYTLGQKLYAYLFPLDGSWVSGCLVCIFGVYGIPFIISTVFGGISRLLPVSGSQSSDLDMKKNLAGSCSDSQLENLRTKNARLSFWYFANPIEWIITVLTVLAAVFGYRWIYASVGNAISVLELVLTGVCILLAFIVLYLPSRAINYLLYGIGSKERQELYIRTITLRKEKLEEYNRDKDKRELLIGLLRKAAEEGYFDISWLPNITCLNDLDAWINLGYKYCLNVRYSGFRLMRQAYSQYWDEWYEKKIAEEEVKRKRAEEEAQRKRAEEEARRKREEEAARKKQEEEEAQVIANIMHQMAMDQYDKGLKTYMTDTRNGEDIYFKNGQYVNESGDRVPIQWIDEGY